MNHATQQRRKSLRAYLESIVAATRGIDEEMRGVPHRRGIARQGLAYKRESIVHDGNGCFRASYYASDGEYYTITVERESRQQLFAGGLLQNISGKAL